MEIPDKAWIAIGTVIATVVAGLISFVNILIAKDQKTTELRQAWIDSLRQVTSEFTAHSVKMVFVRNVTLPIAEKAFHKEGKKDVAYSKLRDFFEKQQRPSLELRNRILLYLNPKEHDKLIQDIKVLHNASQLDSKVDGDEAFKISERVVEQTQVVLKSEWERVKRGERFYRTTKYALAFVLISTLFIIIYKTTQFWVPLFSSMPKP